MRTPADPQRVHDLAHTGDPADAVIRAWTNPGPNPQWHEAARREVRKTMPVLAAALDRFAKR